MESGYLASPLLFLVQIGFGFYTMLLLLRFLLQVTKANFHNPLSQTIVKLTAPALKPLRKVVPGYRGLDLASLVAAWIAASIENLLILAITGHPGALIAALPWALPKVISLTFSIFIFAIVIQAILSWFPSAAGHPIQHIVYRIGSPVMDRIRRLMPSTSGIDFSPMIAIIGLMVAKMLVMPPLYALLGVPVLLQT